MSIFEKICESIIKELQANAEKQMYENNSQNDKTILLEDISKVKDELKKVSSKAANE